ncbi:hypothetical protein D3C85_1504840 [compost metagenome]
MLNGQIKPRFDQLQGDVLKIVRTEQLFCEALDAAALDRSDHQLGKEVFVVLAVDLALIQLRLNLAEKLRVPDDLRLAASANHNVTAQHQLLGGVVGPVVCGLITRRGVARGHVVPAGLCCCECVHGRLQEWRC